MGNELSYDRGQRLLELQSLTEKGDPEYRELRLLEEFTQLRKERSSRQVDVRRLGELARRLMDIEMSGFMHALSSNAHDVATWSLLEENIREAPGNLIECMIDHLHLCRSDFHRHCVIMVLSLTRRAYNATGLCASYDSLGKGHPNRWYIGETLTRSRSRGADDWVHGKLCEADETDDWLRLTEYAARRFPAAEAVGLLLTLVDYAPVDVACALGWCGGAAEIPVLEQMLEQYGKRGDGEIRKCVRRSIKKIEKRTGLVTGTGT